MKRLLILSLIVLIKFSGFSQYNVQLGNGTSNVSSMPFYGLYDYSQSGFIYTEAQLAAIGIYPGAVLSKIEFQFSSWSLNYTANNQTLKLAHVLEDEFPTFTLVDYSNLTISNITTVKNNFNCTIQQSGVHWKPFAFDTPFTYNGGNLLISWENYDGSWAAGYGWLEGDSIPNPTTVTWYSDNTYPNNSSNVNPGQPNIKFEFLPTSNFIAVFNDLDENCVQESELGVEGINLTITPGNYIVTTNSDGLWYFDSLPVGTYNVTLDTTNLNWSTICPVTQTFIVTDPSVFTPGLNFGLINDNPCTDPDVSIFAPSLRRCFSNRPIYVSACNKATATGILDSSYVDVELDPLLTVNSASLPYTDLGNNVFRFETGDINPGQCVNFTLSTTVSCDAQNGQTLCMDATLYPAEDCIFDSIPSDPITNDGIGGTLDGLPGPCTLPWDQSSLQVDGWCQGDSVYFSVTNTGDFGDGDMECYSPVWLTVDGVVTDTDSLQIQGGETVIYSYPASGQTFFLNAEQHPLHPGNSHPNAHVELCGDSTNWTPGIVNEFPQDDADPDVDIYCGQVTAPFDPNDKTGYPLGQTEEYYIQSNQQLQYVIRFQNVGTDTAFTVVVRDTLDIDLNIFTVTPGVSSHPYTFKMYGPRVLEWTFEDIQLPDSTTNSEGSNGFLTFHVDQVPDLAPGTVINNDADIYFDFELPITTNTTVHKIFEGFVEVLNIEDLTIEGKEIFMYPNPTTNLITIQSESVLNNKFKIYDQQGREVMNGKLKGKNTEVSLGKLSKGTYTIQVDGNYKPAVIIKQ